MGVALEDVLLVERDRGLDRFPDVALEADHGGKQECRGGRTDDPRAVFDPFSLSRKNQNDRPSSAAHV
jgi:hypothetical protein